MQKPSLVRIMLRLAVLAALLAMSAALTFGYLGWLHMAFDSFSHFRVHLGAVLLVMVLPLLLLRLWPEAAFALLLGATVIFQTTGTPFSPGLAPAGTPVAEDEAEDAIYRLLHVNLRYDNPTPQAVLSLIGRVRPDVLTLNEVSEHWLEALTRIEAAYPYRVVCPPASQIGGVAILSRRPFAAGSEPFCGDRGSFGHVRLDFGGRMLEVATLHVGWPWPFAQPWQLPRLAPLLGGIGETAIVAGDLNSAPWSHSARRVADAAGARMLRGIGPTWLDRRLPDLLRQWVGLPIDNVMVKGGVLPVGLGTVENVGSDHLPILLEFVLLPPERQPDVLHARWSE